MTIVGKTVATIGKGERWEEQWNHDEFISQLNLVARKESESYMLHLDFLAAEANGTDLQFT